MTRPSTVFAIAKARLIGQAAPVSVGFELTHLCNLACSYCDRHQKLPDELTTPQILVALDGLIDVGMREISLDGGEPLAHPDVDEIVDWLVRRRVVVRMNTNGILVRRHTATVKTVAKVKISLDGPPAIHDAVRGKRAFERAIDGAVTARALGVSVELTCVVGRHNADALDAVLDVVQPFGLGVVFQPARDSLFLEGTDGPGARFRLDGGAVRDAFLHLARRKREGAHVANGWASLRHFLAFPGDVTLPCAAGWINATMDPEGNLFHCGQVDRRDKSANVVKLGAKRAFSLLTRAGCQQCWCARVVEENYAWGGRVDMSTPLRVGAPMRASLADDKASGLVAAASLVRRPR